MATTLGAVAEGSIVYLNESGSPVAFYVAKHDYESALNGAGRTLLVRKDCYGTSTFNVSTTNAYANGHLDKYITETWLPLLDSVILENAQTTKFYYTIGGGDYSVTTLDRTAFALSLTELGLSATGANVEGTAVPVASALQIAYLNGSATQQWTRSPNTTASGRAWELKTDGTANSRTTTSSRGARPALTLPAEMGVDDSGNVVEPKYEYTWLEWIESSGTQWIDTGFVPNQDTRVVFDFEYTKAVSGAQQGVFGSRIALRNAMYLMWTENGNAGWRDGYGTELKYPIGSTISGRVVVDKNKNVLSINETVVNTATYATFNSTYSLYLLTTNNAGSPMIDSYPTYARIYSCQIYDNGTLVRDLVPAKRSDGTVGLYDAVNDRFYTNSGTGSFTAGPEIVESASMSLAAVNGTEVLITACKSNVGGVEYAISYALANIDGIEAMIPFGAGSNLIEFQIETTPDSETYEPFEAEPGMTWEEWCDSDYNTADFYVQTYANYTWIERSVSGGTVSVQYGGNDVSPSDEIGDGTQYTVEWAI